jgi:hypothetical protein
MINIFLSNVMGGLKELKEIQIDSNSNITHLKEIIKSLYLMNDVTIIYNGKILTSGTLNENRIVENSIISIVGSMNTGQSLLGKYMAEKYYEDYMEMEKFLIEAENDIKRITENQSIDYDKKTLIPLTPLTPLDELQIIKENNPEVDIDREDMRILFQRCRNQIEDEYIKEKQRKIENEKISEKIRILRDKMKKQKNKRNNIKTDKTKNNKTTKNNFCGFKKGFLL